MRAPEQGWEMLGEPAQQQCPGNEEGAGEAAETWPSRGRYQGPDASGGKNGKILNRKGKGWNLEMNWMLEEGEGKGRRKVQVLSP